MCTHLKYIFRLEYSFFIHTHHLKSKEMAAKKGDKRIVHSAKFRVKQIYFSLIKITFCYSFQLL